MSGKPRAFFGVVAAVLVLASACTDGSGPAQVEPTPAASSSSPTADTGWEVREGVLDQSVTSRLREGWSEKRSDFLQLLNDNASDTRLVAGVNSEAFAGVAVVDAVTGKVLERVDPYLDREQSQVGGAADESFAVWKEYRSMQGLEDFVVKVWDRQRNQVRQIGESRRGPDGETFSSPWQDPLLLGSHAAWVEGTDFEGGGQLIVADLDSGRRHVITAAHPGWLAAHGSTLIWAESLRRGAPTQLFAVDVNTQKKVALPDGLKRLRGVTSLVYDGASAAWVRLNEVGVSLMLLPSMDSEPVEVKSFTDNGFSPPLYLTDRLLAAQISGGGVLFLDLESGRFAIEKAASFVKVAGPTLMVAPYSEVKPPRPLTLVRVPQEDIANMHDR